MSHAGINTQLLNIETDEASHWDAGLAVPKDVGNAPDWMWSQSFGGSGKDRGKEILSDAEGNIFIAGSFSGEMMLDDQTFTIRGLREGFIAKFGANRQLLWFKKIDAQNHERTELNDLSRDENGNIYATGHFSGTLNVGGKTLASENQQSLLFIKLDDSGNIILAETYEIQKPKVAGTKIKPDGEGNMYILARSDSCSLFKFGSSGELLWEIRDNEYFSDMEILHGWLFITATTYAQS